MQLKVCNPHLILSVWTKDVMKCCTAVTDSSLLKDWSLTGIRDVILQPLKRRAEETWACLHELWDKCFGRKHFFSCIYLLKKKKKKSHVTLQPQPGLGDFLLPGAALLKNPSQLGEIKWHISRLEIPASLTCTLLPFPPHLPFVFFDTCTPISIFQPLRRRKKQPNVCLIELCFFSPSMSLKPLWKKK